MSRFTDWLLTQVQSAFDEVVQWSGTWQLQLVPDKCQFSLWQEVKKKADVHES